MVVLISLPGAGKHALDDFKVIEEKPRDDLTLSRVVEVESLMSPFISSPLGLVPKGDGGRIHHLSHPLGQSVRLRSGRSCITYRYTKFTISFFMMEEIVSFLKWTLRHYLDDFIAVFPSIDAKKIKDEAKAYSADRPLGHTKK